MAELKPCPFCGGKAKHFQNTIFGYFVGCTKCRMRTDYYGSKGSATRAWNRRVGNG